MRIPPEEIHPEGELDVFKKTEIMQAIEVDTFDGKLHVEWDPDAAVTPFGQLPFFIQYLKMGHRLAPWVKECPLYYTSNNAPEKIDILGSLFLSILSGHTRYAHMSTLLNEQVNAQLLGMNKVVSDDSARRGLKKIDEIEGISWIQDHLFSTYEPLLKTPWILDTDVTVKPLYGHQEGANVGYNPHKPGRPSHTYHTYLIANIRIVLDVEVQAGDQSHSSHSMPGLMTVLDKLPANSKPSFIRGDCDWGNHQVMSQLEEKEYHYLFKLKKSKRVKDLIVKHHGLGNWTYFKGDWEAKEDQLKLMGWEKRRRVVIIRRRVRSELIFALEDKNNPQQSLAFIDGPEKMKAYEYAVLVTNLEDELITLIQHYRDRADCENYFDEIKNQWGWGGFTTHDIKSCRLISRIIALVYNWWTLFVRLANPDNHLEAITSRPLLLSSVGRLVKSGRQQKMIVTSHHAKTGKVQKIFSKVALFFTQLKADAPQLTPRQCWVRILERCMQAFSLVLALEAQKLLPAPG